MEKLDRTILKCFNGYSTHFYHYGGRTTLPQYGRKNLQMIIPLYDDKVFEIPTFVLANLYKIKNFLDKDVLVTTLEVTDRSSTYKSLDARIRDGLTVSFSTDKIWCLGMEGDPQRMYYITQGAVFNWDLNPIMMMTWQVEKIHHDLNPPELKLLKPVVRIAPYLFVNKTDAVQRYICGKFLTTALDIGDIYNPSLSCYPPWLNNDGAFRVKVEIDTIPFETKVTDTPTVLTTNAELKDIVLANLEDIDS